MSYPHEARNRPLERSRLDGSAKGTSLFPSSSTLTQHRKHVLRDLVGLCQYGSAGLLQDLREGHVGHFHRVVSVLNARTDGSEVGLVGAQVGDGILKAVLHGTQL